MRKNRRNGAQPQGIDAAPIRAAGESGASEGRDRTGDEAMSNTVDRVHFGEPPFIGPETYRMIPPVEDCEDPVRRKNWTITESGGDIYVEHASKGTLYKSRVPASNVRTVVYVSQKL
jgi:hypothetical protein